jgi:hypothetical protein
MKPWHNDSHSITRREIKQLIFEMLRSRRPFDTTEQNQQLSLNFEDILYYEAKSFKEYNERNTLNKRVQRLTSSFFRSNYKAQVSELQGSPEGVDQIHIEPRHDIHSQQRAQYSRTTEDPTLRYNHSLVSTLSPPPPPRVPVIRSSDISRNPNPSLHSFTPFDSEMYSWHSHLHAPVRENIRILITKLLRYSRPEPTIEWLNKLPQLTRTLEENLYDEATSFQEYHDRKTLKERLQHALALLKNQKIRLNRPHGHAQPPPLDPAIQSMFQFDDPFITMTQLVPLNQYFPEPRNVPMQYFVGVSAPPNLVNSSPPSPPPPRPPPQNEDDRTCIICLDSPRTHLIIPCFHFIACEDCIQNFAVGSECPVCRTRVMETKQVFTS